jgi:hypothetical protein
MNIDEAIAQLAERFQTLAHRVSENALEAIRPQIRQLATQFTREQVRDKLQRNHSCDRETENLRAENLLLEELLKEIKNCSNRTCG